MRETRALSVHLYKQTNVIKLLVVGFDFGMKDAGRVSASKEEARILAAFWYFYIITRYI